MDLDFILKKVSDSLYDTVSNSPLLIGAMSNLDEGQARTFEVLSSVTGKTIVVDIDSEGYANFYDQVIEAGHVVSSKIGEVQISDTLDHFNYYIDQYGGTVGSLLQDVSISGNVNKLFADMAEIFRSKTDAVDLTSLMALVTSKLDGLGDSGNEILSTLATLPNNVTSIDFLNWYKTLTQNVSATSNEDGLEMYANAPIVKGLYGSIILESITTTLSFAALLVSKTLAIVTMIASSVVSLIGKAVNMNLGVDYKVNPCITSSNYNITFGSGESSVPLLSDDEEGKLVCLDRGYANFYIWNRRNISILPKLDLKVEKAIDFAVSENLGISLVNNGNGYFTLKYNLNAINTVKDFIDHGYLEDYEYTITESIGVNDDTLDRNLLASYALFVLDGYTSLDVISGQKDDLVLYDDILSEADTISILSGLQLGWSLKSQDAKNYAIFELGLRILFNIGDARSKPYGNYRSLWVNTISYLNSVNGSAPLYGISFKHDNDSRPIMISLDHAYYVVEDIYDSKFMRDVTCVPQSQRYTIPDYDDNAIQRTLLVSAIASAAVVTASVAAKVVIGQKLRRWAFDQRNRLSVLRNQAEEDGTYQSWKMLDKSTRRYNLAARLLGLQQYDYYNDWGEYGSNEEVQTYSNTALLQQIISLLHGN